MLTSTFKPPVGMSTRIRMLEPVQVQVPRNHILTQDLCHNCHSPHPEYLLGAWTLWVSLSPELSNLMGGSDYNPPPPLTSTDLNNPWGPQPSMRKLVWGEGSQRNP